MCVNEREKEKVSFEPRGKQKCSTFLPSFFKFILDSSCEFEEEEEPSMLSLPLLFLSFSLHSRGLTHSLSLFPPSENSKRSKANRLPIERQTSRTARSVGRSSVGTSSKTAQTFSNSLRKKRDFSTHAPRCKTSEVENAKMLLEDIRIASSAFGGSREKLEKNSFSSRAYAVKVSTRLISR